MLLDSTMSIGERFKHIRTEKGFSQSELAEGICSKTVVSHLENDRQYPSASMLGKLADKLGVPLREIMGMQEKQFEAAFQIEMIRVYIERGEYNRSLELIDDLEDREDLLDHQRTNLFILRAECYLWTKRYENAVDMLLPFLGQQQRLQSLDDETLCDTYNKLGNAHYRMNEFEKAYSAFEQGYRISLRLAENGRIAARVTKNLGLTCNQLGYLEDARYYLEKAYRFFERVSDMRGLANTLFDMAIATGQPEHMERARSLYEELSLVREANFAKQYYAYHVESKLDYHLGIQHLEESTEFFESIGDVEYCVFTATRSALVCLSRNDIDKAESYLELAEKYHDRIKDKGSYVSVEYYRARATFYLQQKKFDECILNSECSSEICDKMGLKSEKAVSLQLAAEAYFQKGMGDAAYLISKRIFEIFEPKGRTRE